MSRAIDLLPTPKAPKQMKIIVLSAGRNGTQSLFSAFKILGYTPYHMTELAREGRPHVNVMIEALEAKYKGIGSKYGRKEFDKWFGNYDVLIAMPTFLLEDVVAAYPECKFILTTREDAAWLKSVNNTFKKRMIANSKFPFKYLAYVDPFTNRMMHMLRTVQFVLWGGKAFDDEGADEAILDFYHQHNKKAVEITPPQRLLVVRLEDGLGWEEICPFLGIPIPEIPYPRGNVPNDFHKTAKRLFYSSALSTFRGFAYAAVPAAAALAAWWYAAGQAKGLRMQLGL